MHKIKHTHCLWRVWVIVSVQSLNSELWRWSLCIRFLYHNHAADRSAEHRTAEPETATLYKRWKYMLHTHTHTQTYMENTISSGEFVCMEQHIKLGRLPFMERSSNIMWKGWRRMRSVRGVVNTRGGDDEVSRWWYEHFIDMVCKLLFFGPLSSLVCVCVRLVILQCEQIFSKRQLIFD